MPLATPPTPPSSAPLDTVYGMGRLDASGRIGDRAAALALGWLPGDQLTITATPDRVVARRDETGMVTLSGTAYIAIPAALRLRCGLHVGDRVLWAATLRDSTLAIYPLATVDQAIRILDHPEPTDHAGQDARRPHTTVNHTQQEGSGR